VALTGELSRFAICNYNEGAWGVLLKQKLLIAKIAEKIRKVRRENRPQKSKPRINGDWVLYTKVKEDVPFASLAAVLCELCG